MEDTGLGSSGWVSGLQSWRSLVEPGEGERHANDTVMRADKY